jgi:hypothetical protein
LKREFLNQLINFFWTAAGFAVVLMYWLKADSNLVLGILIILSLLPAFLPSRFLQLSNHPKIYEQWGVKRIRQFVQNGDLVNKATANTEPGQNHVKDSRSREKYLRTIVMYERYHLICFAFFCLTALHAGFNGEARYALTIMLSNVLYNIAPILLQQYNRARILKLNK